MATKYRVCQGATCMCKFGTAPDKLKVKTQNKHYINDKDCKTKLAATNKELGATFEKNSFGSCSKMNNNPCQATVTEWSGYYGNITIEMNKGKSLLEDSKATCPVGGKDCISIIKHGQSIELSQQNLENTSSLKVHLFNPFMDIDELLDELDGLDAY